VIFQEATQHYIRRLHYGQDHEVFGQNFAQLQRLFGVIAFFSEKYGSVLDQAEGHEGYKQGKNGVVEQA
jgi:hypothetical protein